MAGGPGNLDGLAQSELLLIGERERVWAEITKTRV